MKRYIRCSNQSTYTKDDIKWIENSGDTFIGALKNGKFFMASTYPFHDLVIVDDDPTYARDANDEEPWTNEWMDAHSAEYWTEAESSTKTRNFFSEIFDWLDDHGDKYYNTNGMR